MRNTAIHNSRGFSVLELTIAVFLLFFIFAITTAVKGRVTAAQGVRTMIEMQAILDAARQYYLANNQWPNTMAQLKTLLPNIQANNVFGNVYNLVPNGNVFTVNTVVPYKSVNAIESGRFVALSDTGSANLVQLSTPIPMNSQIGRLQYEQTWIH